MNGRSGFLFVMMFLWAVTAHSVEAVVSYALFYKPAAAGKDSAFLEVTWQINPSSLHYRKNDQGNLVGAVQTAVSLSVDTGLLLRERYTLQTTPLPPGKAAGQSLLQFKRFYVPPGEVRLRIDLGETEFAQQNFQYVQDIRVDHFPATASVANIQILDTFFASSVPSPFLKNGHQQLPRPLNFYNDGQRLVHFYTEMYASNHTGEPLIQHFYLSKRPNDYPIARLQLYDTLPKAAAVNGSFHTLSLATLPSGNYYLNAHLQTMQGNVLDTESTFLQIINKTPDEVKITAQDSAAAAKPAESFFDLGKTFVAKFTTKQILAILKMISPNADPVETNVINNFFKRPDDAYMRYFVYNYFSKTNKEHPEQAWKEFSDLIREVNREFNSGNSMGYETERGRVYLKYGKPDERVRVPNEAGAVPYEIWRYNAVGPGNQTGTFLFYQPAFSINDYRLLTSTVTGELYNPSWKSMLYSTGRASGNSNSRAEQYLDGR